MFPHDLPVWQTVYSYFRLWRITNTWLEINASHALRAAALPLHHRDPFDRMLIAQAQVEDMILVSADSTFNQYEVDYTCSSRYAFWF